MCLVHLRQNSTFKSETCLQENFLFVKTSTLQRRRALMRTPSRGTGLYLLGTPDTSRRGRSTRKALSAFTSNPAPFPPSALAPSALVACSKMALKSLEERGERSHQDPSWPLSWAPVQEPSLDCWSLSQVWPLEARERLQVDIPSAGVSHTRGEGALPTESAEWVRGSPLLSVTVCVGVPDLGELGPWHSC